MINFDVLGAHNLLQLMRSQEIEARKKDDVARRIPGGQDRPDLTRANDAEKGTIVEIARLAEAAFKCLDQATLQVKFNAFFLQMNYSSLWSEVAAEIKALRKAIEDELQVHHFYHYPRDRGDKVQAFAAEWGNIWPTYTAVQDEALAAVDCYAMDHPTASVFHSMRVAEHGLRALARERKIKVKNRPIEWATWNEIIKALEDERKVIANMSAGARKDADLAFYSGAVSDLHSFKDEYRNMAMHVRATYDHLQALRALERVREFMQRVSGRLDENGKKRKP